MLYMSQSPSQSIIPSTDVIQFTLTLKVTTVQVLETSVTVNNNSPIKDYVHPDDQTQPTFEVTPLFKPFTTITAKEYKIHFCPFHIVLHCLVRPCGRWSLTGGWKQFKILKLSAEKVVAVAYGRWWFMRGSSIRFWLRIFLVFWKGGGLYGRWSYVEVRLYFFPIYY